MSTRARIGLLTGDNVRSIYCHYDGYPEGVGATLREHYTGLAKVNALLDLGDLSELGAELGDDQGPGWFDIRDETIRADENDPRRQWTLAYRRDRGETDVDAVTHPADEWPDYGQEYEYVGTVTAEGVAWEIRSE
jgi:hypothetical protein